jgi:hypothetical protein
MSLANNANEHGLIKPKLVRIIQFPGSIVRLREMNEIWRIYWFDIGWRIFRSGRIPLLKIVSPAKRVAQGVDSFFRNADKPDEVFVLLEWEDHEGSREFVQSSDLKEELERSGVCDEPDFYFLEEVARPAI